MSSERKYRETGADKDFCPNKEAFLWRPHVLDNCLLTVGHEFIRSDAEICIPYAIKELGWKTKKKKNFTAITNIPEAHRRGASCV